LGRLARKYWALLAILFLGTFLRVYQLGTESLWRDEGWTTWFASLGGPSEIVEQSKTDNNFPTYYLVLRYWIGLFGDSEFSVRFPSALAGVLAVAIYKVGQFLFGRSTGLIASLLLTLSPFHIAYSQEARVYSLMTLLAVLSFYFFLEVLAKSNAAARTGYILSTTALLYCHVYGLFIVLAQNIYYLATAFLGKAFRSRDEVRPGWGGGSCSKPSSSSFTCRHVSYWPVGFPVPRIGRG
jgi:mannosyltransferase